MLNVGIIHGFVGGGGGTEKTLLQIINSLKKYHNLTLYTISKPSVKIDGIKIKSKLPFKLATLGLYQRFLEYKLLDTAKDNDVLIESSGGLAIHDNMSQKIIVYCHGSFEDELLKTDSKYKGVWVLYYKLFQKLSIKSLQKINNDNVHLVSNSNYIKSSIYDNFQKDSTVIYPPVNVDSFDPNVKKLSNVITISRYSSEKNLDFALDTIMQTNYDYTIIGNTKTKSNILYLAHLYSKSKKHLSITLENNIKRNILIDKLNKSKVYFHASEETFGITVVESIAAGCIPIVPDNTAHKETVPINELRYVPNNSADASDKLQKALSGKFDHYLPQLQQNIHNYDEKHFTQSFKNFIENLSN